MRMTLHAEQRRQQRCPGAGLCRSIPIPRRYGEQIIGATPKLRRKRAARFDRRSTPKAPTAERNRRARYRITATGLFVLRGHTAVTTHPVSVPDLAGLLCWLMLSVWP